MGKFNVGDSVWVARAEYREISEPCPVCFGKCRVDLLLGNGDSVTLPCGYCGHGYNAPTGSVTERVFYQGDEPLVIDSVNVQHTAEGERVEYGSNSYILYEEDTFANKEEALARGEEKAAKINEERRTRAESIKADVKKTFAWNAGYHLREAKRKEKEALRHRDLAVLCKSRAKAEAT